MAFAEWSPSHTLLLILTVLAFGGQLIIVLTYLKVTTKQHTQDIKQLAELIQRQGERLEDRIEHSIDEVRAEIRDVRIELSKLNQNHIDHLTHHER